MKPGYIHFIQDFAHKSHRIVPRSQLRLMKQIFSLYHRRNYPKSGAGAEATATRRQACTHRIQRTHNWVVTQALSSSHTVHQDGVSAGSGSGTKRPAAVRDTRNTCGGGSAGKGRLLAAMQPIRVARRLRSSREMRSTYSSRLRVGGNRTRLPLRGSNW